jgi:thiol-disulfide isomerase/thioredoxin
MPRYPHVLALVLTLASSLPCLAGEQRPFVRGSWQELRQEHAGHDIVVHFWGITCGPCLAELPRWGQFIHERPDLDVVMVAADPVVVDADTITATLAKAGLAAAESWMFADPFTERLAYEIDPRWAGELPYTLLIRDGAVKGVLGAADFTQLRDWAGRRTDK